MPEVDGNDPEIRVSTYVNLIPCSTPDAADPNIAHAYEARQMTAGTFTQSLGWLSLAAARETYADVPYAVRWGSHGICPPCMDAMMNA